MKKICVIIITAILLVLSLYNVVNAITRAELEQQRIELQLKIEETGKNLENIQVQLTENLEQINALDAEIYNYEKQIEQLTKSLSQIEKQLEETETVLNQLQKKYEKQRKLLAQRIVSTYKAGQTRYLDVLLSANNISDFISKYYYIGKVIEYDENLIDNVLKQKKQMEQIKEQLETTSNRLKENKTEQKKITVSLENAKIVRSSYQNKLTAEELKIQEDLEVYQDELKLVELNILLATMEENGSQYVGGTFAWPAPGYYTITSPYGMRNHPIIHVYTNHSGMDIGAPMGSYAIAANDGIVTTATYSNSYGNMIIINHGGGISTLYGHASELLVKAGDVVKRGDPILKVGSTGWSTGPHLHFEIRVNGVTIDPYPYVTNKILNEQEETNDGTNSTTNEENTIQQ